MGQPKAELIYFDRPQWAYCTNLLGHFCDRVWVSLEKEDQIDDVPLSMQLIDGPEGQGPLKGILSAMRQHPDKSWLIMACDMPGVDMAVMHRLFRLRDPEATITCFVREGDNSSIEPLLSFWESGTLPLLEKFVKNSWSPREFIKKHHAHLVPLEDSHFSKLKSINTPEERTEFIRKYSYGKDRFEEIG
jgi:molybdopterin-guanine dinucleotide biosynthesis protein A